MKKQIPYILIILGIVLFYFWRYRQAPSIEFEKMDVLKTTGEQIQLNSILNGKIVIHFYASWCGPCIREIKEMKENYVDLKKEDIKIIFITDDNFELINKMKLFLDNDIEIFQIPSLQDAGIYTLPTTYFTLNKKIESKHVDAVKWNLENIRTFYKD